MDDFEFVDRILHRPRMHFGSAGSLRDVPAIMYGFSVGRYPPNGYGFLPGFPEFVGLRFNRPITCHYKTLLDNFEHLPWKDGLDEVWKLVLEWKDAYDSEGPIKCTFVQ